MLKIIAMLVTFFVSTGTLASGSGLKINSVYYCAADFSMLMSNGERWVVRKADVGEQKLNHFISMAMYMMAADKATGNVFPNAPIAWCGNTDVRPISIFSFVN